MSRNTVIDEKCIELNSIALKIVQIKARGTYRPTHSRVSTSRMRTAGSGSHGQLFRPYLGPVAWQSRCVNERGKPAPQEDPFLPAEVS